jgi:hypothetical protein
VTEQAESEQGDGGVGEGEQRGTRRAELVAAAQERWAAALADHPGLEAFFAEDRPEPFFVKNLERVQGDERDSIILSIGYGKHRDGRMRYHWGPLLVEEAYREAVAKVGPPADDDAEAGTVPGPGAGPGSDASDGGRPGPGVRLPLTPAQPSLGRPSCSRTPRCQNGPSGAAAPRSVATPGMVQNGRASGCHLYVLPRMWSM